jgi:pimeloyl-ACP methyl ester carboxylesterase
MRRFRPARRPGALPAALLALAALLAPAERAPAQSSGPRSGRPGTLLDWSFREQYSPARIDELVRPLFEGLPLPSLRFSVDTYQLRYRSTDFDGSPADIQALLFVPRFLEPESRPLLVFGSGTTGISDGCAPSREAPEMRRWGHYRANMLAYASVGFVTVFPDYLGFNDPNRPQRYFSRDAEAHVLLDAARAAKAFFAEYPQKVRPSGAVFAAGYSQGGHAAFAAADLCGSYAPELGLRGIVGFAATTSVTALLKEGPYYAAFVLFSYAAMYGARLDPGQYLQERWARSLQQDADSLCVDEFQKYYPADGSKLYRPQFYEALHADRLAREYPELAAVLEANQSGLSGHGLPALVVQGEADSIVTTFTQAAFVERLRRAGSQVDFLVLKGITHRLTRQAGFLASVEWMERQAEAASVSP